MRFICPLLVVKDIERSQAFYPTVLHSRVLADLGANVTMEGRLPYRRRKAGWPLPAYKRGRSAMEAANRSSTLSRRIWTAFWNAYDLTEREAAFTRPSKCHGGSGPFGFTIRMIISSRWGSRCMRLLSACRHKGFL